MVQRVYKLILFSRNESNIYFFFWKLVRITVVVTTSKLYFYFLSPKSVRDYLHYIYI